MKYRTSVMIDCNKKSCGNCSLNMFGWCQATFVGEKEKHLDRVLEYKGNKWQRRPRCLKELKEEK